MHLPPRVGYTIKKELDVVVEFLQVNFCLPGLVSHCVLLIFQQRLIVFALSKKTTYTSQITIACRASVVTMPHNYQVSVTFVQRFK